MEISRHIRYRICLSDFPHMLAHSLAGKQISDCFVGRLFIILSGNELYHIISVHALRLKNGDIALLTGFVKQPVSRHGRRSIVASIFSQASVLFPAVGILLLLICIFHTEILEIFSSLQPGGHLVCLNLQLVHCSRDFLIRHAGLFLGSCFGLRLSLGCLCGSGLLRFGCGLLNGRGFLRCALCL